jgi:hypothetical protein
LGNQARYGLAKPAKRATGLIANLRLPIADFIFVQETN